MIFRIGDGKIARGCPLGSEFIKIFQSRKVPNSKLIFRIGYGKIGQGCPLGSEFLNVF